MKFSREELKAIYKVGKSMMIADGEFAQEELMVIFHELCRFGVRDEYSATLLEQEAIEMEFDKAFAIISRMDKKQKKYIAAYLGLIMASDGIIDERETMLWGYVSQICNLPEMSIEEALIYMRDFNA